MGSGQGRWAGFERINYKRAGDGVLIDIIACPQSAAILAGKLRCDDTDQIPDMTNGDVSRLHRRCLYLLSKPHLKGKFRTVHHDNLFTSLKFAWYAWKLYGFHTNACVRQTGLLLEAIQRKRQEKRQGGGTEGKRWVWAGHPGSCRFRCLRAARRGGVLVRLRHAPSQVYDHQVREERVRDADKEGV